MQVISPFCNNLPAALLLSFAATCLLGGEQLNKADKDSSLHQEDELAKQDLPGKGGYLKDTTSLNRLGGAFSPPRYSAFDRFINHGALASAWTNLDPAGFTDGALQTLEAERVLGRAAPNLSAEQLVSLAVRLALEKHDRESLDRLEKGAAQANRPELVAAIVVARKTAGPSRTSSTLAPVTPEDTDVATFAVYRAFLHDIQAARLCGDARALAAIDTDLARVSQFTDAEREGLRQQITDARAVAGESTSVPDALDRLVGQSRGWQWQGVKSRWVVPEYHSTVDPPSTWTPPRPRPTGPQLGNQAAGQQTSGGFQNLSYEQRQAALQLLKNPNAFKPTPARRTQ